MTYFAFRYLLLIILGLSCSWVQGQAESISKLAKQNSYTLGLNEDRLSGEGGELLLFEATRAQFFLLGEEKGIAELPQITWALYNHAFRMGLRFNHLAIEVSPFAAQQLEDLGLEADALYQLEQYFQNHPGEIPFYALKEEQALLDRVLETAESNLHVLWGIAEPAAAASPSLLKEMLSLAPDKNAEKTISRYLKQVEKNPAATLLQWEDDDFANLREHFSEDHDDPEVRGWIDDLKATQGMLRQLAEGDSLGTARGRSREALMKKHFRGYFQSSLELQAEPPRVMAKLGYEHLYRGKHATHNFASLGNFIQNYAQRQKMRSFNLMVIGGKGRGRSVAQADGTWITDSLSLADEAWMAPLVEIVGEDEWRVVELKALRGALDNPRYTIDPKMRRLIEEYDAILILGNSSPATRP